MSSKTFLVINSGWRQFRIHHDGYVFVVNGHLVNTCSLEDQRVSTANEFIQNYAHQITSWCSITILQAKIKEFDIFSFPVIHRFFKNIQEEKSEIIKTIDALQQFDTYLLLYCLTKKQLKCFLLF